jgi:uncharacterized protein YbgA (DUF1722 family)/uncharacterized protein YbbK (DUF523 family)
MSEKPRIGISSCLLGNEVRHDGGHKRDRYLTDTLARFVEFVPVCPELEVGMGVPREPVRLVGAASSPRLIGQKSGKDWTDAMQAYARKRVTELGKLLLMGYILKKDSPSCGMERVRVYGGAHVPNRLGQGMFARALAETLPLLPLEEEGRLNDPVLRENFIERVFAYQRWFGAMSGRASLEKVIDFHTRHKLTIFAHSEKHLRLLGRIVANAKARPLGEVVDEYGRVFMEALRHRATTKRNTNVLQHMAGYFSGDLTTVEKNEIGELVNDYRLGLIPLVVPLTLIKHYATKLQVQYILEQSYLNPHPKELMLRNHA